MSDISLQRVTRVLRAVVVGPLLAGCPGPSGTGVPKLQGDALSEPRLEGLAPRKVSLRVVDARKPLPESTREMVAELDRALGERFRRSGFEVAAAAPNEVVFTVRYNDKPLADYEREDCVWITAKITTPRAWAESEGGACYEWRNAYGMDLGGDASQAFETALSGAIDMLDRSWRKARGLE